MKSVPGRDEGIRILIEALLLAGMTIMIIGNTRAVASVEHNIAHYWEMMQLMHHKKPPQHGDKRRSCDAARVANIHAFRSRRVAPRWTLTQFTLNASAVRSVQNGCSMPMVMKQAMPLCVIMRETSSLGRNRNAAFLAHSRALLKSGRVSRNFHHLNAYTPTLQKLDAPLTPQDCGVDRGVAESIYAVRQGLPHALYALQNLG